MDLPIEKTYNRRVITPYEYLRNQYYLLFYRNDIEGPFFVEDAPYSLSGMLTIGDVKRKSDRLVVGNVFHTTAHALCYGSSLLAYSGLFKMSVNARIPKNLDMPLVIKTPFMQVFNQKNKATLVVSTSLKASIKANLEI